MGGNFHSNYVSNKSLHESSVKFLSRSFSASDSSCCYCWWCYRPRLQLKHPVTRFETWEWAGLVVESRRDVFFTVHLLHMFFFLVVPFFLIFSFRDSSAVHATSIRLPIVQVFQRNFANSPFYCPIGRLRLLLCIVAE